MIGAIGTVLGKWFLGGGLSKLTEQLSTAYQAKLNAENSRDRIAAEVDMARIQAAIEAINGANADRWSATSIGRYLIVVPFGIWWTSIFLDSIFSFSWDVLAVPPMIMSMAQVLIPAILIADAGAIVGRRIGRR